MLCFFHGAEAPWHFQINSSLRLTYAALKRKLVQLRYSIDDQMAVLLNADPDETRRMQAWRDWAGEAARAGVQ